MIREEIQQKVMELTGISVDDQLVMLFEAGCNYLALLHVEESHALALLTDRCYDYWDWWLMEWLENDARFCNDALTQPRQWRENRGYNYTNYVYLQQFAYRRLTREIYEAITVCGDVFRTECFTINS